WLARVGRDMFCSECSGLIIKPGPIDVTIENKLGSAPLGYVRIVGITYASDSFIDALDLKNTRHHLNFGKLYNSSGKMIDGFSTIRGDHMLQVRGAVPPSTIRQCSTCGRWLYTRLGKCR